MTTKNFFLQYGLAFVWMGLAIASLGILAALLLTRTPRGDFNPQIASLLVVNVCAALTRFFVDGGRFQREALERNEIDNFAMNMFLRLIQIALLAVVWPFIEIFRQIRFLLKARQGWERGEVLVTQNGRELHAG